MSFFQIMHGHAILYRTPCPKLGAVASLDQSLGFSASGYSSLFDQPARLRKRCQRKRHETRLIPWWCDTLTVVFRHILRRVGG